MWMVWWVIPGDGEQPHGQRQPEERAGREDGELGGAEADADADDAWVWVFGPVCEKLLFDAAQWRWGRDHTHACLRGAQSSCVPATMPTTSWMISLLGPRSWLCARRSSATYETKAPKRKPMTARYTRMMLLPAKASFIGGGGWWALGLGGVCVRGITQNRPQNRPPDHQTTRQIQLLPALATHPTTYQGSSPDQQLCRRWPVRISRPC